MQTPGTRTVTAKGAEISLAAHGQAKDDLGPLKYWKGRIDTA
jgi:hypothetical protein